MKIRAIRLREVGCFSAPVAIEGLTGGLDVLAGPNELGKSTILRALNLLFTAKHTAQTRNVGRLRPYAGGAPLVEADFTIGGHPWRLRKQFLSERQAVLTDLATGRVAARGEAAHQQALELIGGRSEDRIGLLWLEQGASLQTAALEDGAHAELSRVIEREIAAASGAGELRQIQALAADQRRALVSGHAPPRPVGEYQRAIASREAAARALDEARSVASQAARRLDRAEALRQRRAALADPAAVETRRTRLKRLAAARDAAVAARQRLRIAEAEVAAREGRHAEIRLARDALARQIGEAAEVAAATASASAAAAQASVRAATLADAVAEGEARRQDLRARIEIERGLLAARERLDRRREAVERKEHVAEQLAAARAASTRAGELRDRLRDDPVTEGRVASAEREAGSIAALEARIAAQLPKVRIAYSPGAGGRIRVAGCALEDGAVLTPSAALELEIDGIGRVIVEPAAGGELDENLGDLDAHRAELASLFAAMSLASLDEARGRLAGRRLMERELGQAEDRLAARAPAGLMALEAALRQLTAMAGGPGRDDLPERPQIEAEIARHGEALRKAEAELERVSREHAGASRELARLAGEEAVRSRRADALAREMPPVQDRTRVLSALDADLESARQAADAALRERAAWADSVLGDAALRALEAEIAEAAQAERTDADERARIERDLAVIERELQRDQEEGIGSRVEECRQRLTLLSERVGGFESELGAVNLLLEVLEQVERDTRGRYLGPVLGRLERYLGQVFPGASVALGPRLEVECLVRGASREQLSVLSEGTREQIAVLVRLAFGQMLADDGRPTPLILDDALVYADDRRIGALFAALRNAAQAYQVIVLTCRSTSFAPLGGNRLALAPWADG